MTHATGIGRVNVNRTLLAGLLGLGLLLAVQIAQSGPPPIRFDSAPTAYQKLPLSFVPNEGQTDPRVRYYAQGAGFGFYFTDKAAVLSFQGHNRGQALQLRFGGASPRARLAPERRGAATVSYLKGDDPKRWQSGLPTYGQLAYHRLWPGIDMRFRGAGGKLKYEFALRPGARPERIRLAYAGASSLSLAGDGGLLIGTARGTLHDSRPSAYQRVGGRRVPVASRYSLLGGNAYRFEVGAYDRSRPLVIDPGLVYSTFLGGSGTDLGNGIALDSAGNAYIAGRAGSLDFPATAGAFDVSANGSDDAFVAKLNASGTALAYATYLGGAGAEEATAIALDGDGNAYVTGSTTSSGFPTTSGSFDTSYNGTGDAFLTKLDPSGAALEYSTFLGGSGGADYGNAVAVDGSGSAYVTGYTNSGGFPTTPGAFDTTFTGGGSFDAFVTKLDSSGTALSYSTFLGGGGGTDIGNAIAVDGSGSAYVAGGTRSASFPTTAGAFDTTPNGDDDGFVTKLDASGSSLSYSTRLGGSGIDGAGAIALDGTGSTYLTGYTDSTDFPTTPGAYDTSYNDGGDAFVTKLDAAGASLGYSTFLGGTDPGGAYDSGGGIAIDGGGNAYVTGRTDSLLFPTTSGALDTSYNGVGDVFVTKLDGAGGALAYSTYLGGSGTDVGGGIALDSAGIAHVTGYTTSSGYPTTAGAFDTSFNGGYDAFVSKVDTALYAHPSSAPSVDVSLVPVFRQCRPPGNPPNGEHAPPLAQPSCNSPQPTAANARSGGTSVGFAHVGVIAGDAAITVQITNVQNTAGNDFASGLSAIAAVRLTDQGNCTPAPCSGAYTRQGTATDVDFGPIPMNCAPQGSPTAAPGSTCSVSATVNAVVPGALVAGRESVAQIFRVRILDDSTASRTLFEQQGILAP